MVTSADVLRHEIVAIEKRILSRRRLLHHTLTTRLALADSDQQRQHLQTEIEALRLAMVRKKVQR